jgi:hypothetical protein
MVVVRGGIHPDTPITCRLSGATSTRGRASPHPSPGSRRRRAPASLRRVYFWVLSVMKVMMRMEGRREGASYSKCIQTRCVSCRVFECDESDDENEEKEYHRRGITVSQYTEGVSHSRCIQKRYVTLHHTSGPGARSSPDMVPYGRSMLMSHGGSAITTPNFPSRSGTS